MKILVLGATGMLGHKLVFELGKRHQTFAGIREEDSVLVENGICEANHIFTGVDATDFETVRKVLVQVRPDVVLNAVGAIKQKSDSMDALNAVTINSIFPQQLASGALEVGARLITFSTDCVFDGRDGRYIESDFPNAEDLYGRTKAMGEVEEDHCLTIRSSIIGRELKGEKSLLEWIVSNRNGSVKGFANAFYSGFTTLEMSAIIEEYVLENSDLCGVVHISSDRISKFELLKLINLYFELGIDIEKEEEFFIDRSLNSDRFREMTGFQPKSWDQMISEIAADPSPYEEWRKLKL